MNVEASPSEEGLKVTLNYTKQNWVTSEETPVTLEISGKDMKEIAQKVFEHVSGLEMGAGTELAKDTTITTPEGKMSFDEFMAKNPN